MSREHRSDRGLARFRHRGRPTRSHVPPRPAGPDRPPPGTALLREVRTTLAAPGPLPLLLRCAALLTRNDRGHGRARPDSDPDELIAALAAVDRVESTAVLTVIAELGSDATVRGRAQAHARARSHQLPAWLTGLTPVRVRRTVTIAHVLGGGRTLLVGLRTGTGAELCLAVSTDPHPTGPTTDTVALALPVEQVVVQVRTSADDARDLVIEEPTLAEVRSRLSAAADRPAGHPLIAWVLRNLPELPPTGEVRGPGTSGGAGPIPEPLVLVERFLASPAALPLPANTVRSLLPRLLRSARDWGAGDPRRWGPDTVEHLLFEVLPAGLALPELPGADLPGPDLPGADLPGADGPAASAADLLRAFVRFGHSECGIRPGLTEQTLAAIERATLLLEPPADILPRRDERQALLGLLAAAVGGRQTLATLDTDPLPDEPLDLGALPRDARGGVAAVARLIDRCCQTLFDHELRSACRRLLVDVATADPTIFGPGVATEATAATVVWAVAKANHRLGRPGVDPPGGGLGGWFGLDGAVPSTSRATALLAALGITSRVAVRDGLLGSPRYLVADRRRQLIASRDRILTP